MYAGGNVTLSGGTNTFTGNTATDSGGAVSVMENVNISGGNNIFTENRASRGGAVFAQSGSVTLSGTATFEKNEASQGGAIYAYENIFLTPNAGNEVAFKNASDTLRAELVHFGGEGSITFADGFNNPDAKVIHFGTNNYTAFNSSTGWTANDTMNVAQNSTIFKSKTFASTTGGGKASPYATITGNYYLANDQILSLDMNVANSTLVPYFSVTNGNVTSGTNTTLYGVIGGNLTAATDNFLYAIFNVTNGNGTGFAPTKYVTSNALVEFVQPTFWGNETGGTFTVGLKRQGSTAPIPEPDPDPILPTPDPDPVPPTPTPDPDPVPPTPTPDPKPVITGDFLGMFPANSLKSDMETILYYDYLYNGGTIANPGPGTLIGQNAFLDQLFFVLPTGQEAYSKETRRQALSSAVSIADLSGSVEMIRDTGNRLRGQIFSPRPVMADGGLAVTVSDQVTFGEDTRSGTVSGNRVGLWAVPTYSHESGKKRGMYDGARSGYDFDIYGGTIGLDALFGDGQFRAGAAFTTGHGELDSTGNAFKTKNKADYYGGALFGAWRPAPEWEFGAYAGYITQENDVSQNNILYLESDFDTSLWQFGINARYVKEIGNNGKRKFTANAGTDAQFFHRDSASVKYRDKTIGRLGKDDVNQVQIPLTVGIEDTFEFENGSKLTLDGHVGGRLTLGDMATKSDWSIPGGSHKASIKGPDADRATGLVGVGALWRKDRLSIGMGYDAELGEKRTNHQITGQIKWTF